MEDRSIGFIGGGNMARSLIGGLIHAGTGPDRIVVCDTDPSQLDTLKRQFSVETTTQSVRAVEMSDVLIMAVKPQVMESASAALTESVQTKKPLVISVAAGITMATLERWFGPGVGIVRVMPNTPSLVGSGAAALFANQEVSEVQRNQAESIMRAVGVTVWLDDEDLMDAVTAISGSGPAYFFYVMEHLERSAVAMGLEPSTARLLTLETAFGAARLALESSDSPAELRRKVSSPGGTTERAIGVFEDASMGDTLERGARASAERSKELAEILGGTQ
jgi:pyrroline-5-carboxylate reductase